MYNVWIFGNVIIVPAQMSNVRKCEDLIEGSYARRGILSLPPFIHAIHSKHNEVISHFCKAIQGVAEKAER